MAVTLNASTSAGFVQTADTSGVLQLQTANTTAVTVDASQNMGLGVTPSAWAGTGVKAFQFQNGALAASSSFGTMLSWNAYYDGSYKYTASSTAGMYQVGGAHTWYVAPSGTAGNAITFTQAMTLDASGNLGVGTTSPSVRLHVKASTAAADVVYAVNSNNRGLNVNTTASDNLQISHTNSNYNIDYWVSGTGVHTFSTGGSERARIDSSGNLLVGTDTTVGSSRFSVNRGNAGLVSAFRTAIASGSVDMLSFYDGDTQVCGTITISATANTTSYGTSSDYRLKTNVTPMEGALQKIALLKPCTWNWAHAPEVGGQGFVAHELAEVCPDAVVGEKDAVGEDGNPKYQTVDTSFLVATLTAAIQEQQAIIEQLKADVAALKDAA